ncbi:PadR family transcriptional regulator [Dactylosporangium sp. CA-152071]|uniref:PadR family transcriptional regulator n=1 Tax=Dactylosporangium sp. CA-152071 TaxID=3239933 RepID=UPI003D8DEB80
MNTGHLYQILDRLYRDGMVSSERQSQAVKPDRVIYEITEAGAAELRRWLSEAGP